MLNTLSIEVVSLIAFVLGFLVCLVVAIVYHRRVMTKTNVQITSERMQMEILENQRLDEYRQGYERRIIKEQLELASTKSKLDILITQDKDKNRRLSELEQLRIEHSKLETRFEEKARSLAAERVLLSDAKQALFREFQVSANKIFDEKHKSFQQSSKTNIELALGPFQQQLSDFHKKVDSVYSQENAQRNQLLGQILELQKHTKKVSTDASNLARALKGDSKIQGDWGEVILERLLEQSGLTKGREYDIQNSFTGDDGRQLRPDVVVYLPENKHIIIDAKVSLTDFERFNTESSTDKRKEYLVKHVESLKRHIRSLSQKHYEQINQLQTLDFVFIFIPIEAAYLFALESNTKLFHEAYEKRIILASPSSLMVALKTVEAIWRYEKQNKNAEEIANSAGKLYDQFVLVTESLDQLGGYLSKAEKSYDQLYKRFTTGRGNLLGRVDRLKDLGAKTNKRLPDEIESELKVQKEEFTSDLSKSMSDIST